MDLDYGIIHSGYRHLKYARCKYSMYNIKSFTRRVLRNETFAFQIILNSNEEFLCSLNEFNNISWKGLINRIRVSIDLNDDTIHENVKLSLVDYIVDDNGSLTADIISDKDSLLVEGGIAQLIWVKGKVPLGFNGSFNFNINLFYTKEYDDEELIGSIPCEIKVLDYDLPSLQESPFYLDLWQHLSSLARHYNVPIFSDDHFYIIENFIKELASAGQKTITIVASDFPWGGQGCFKVHKNASNLFEHNIVSVRRDVNGELYLDFTSLDRYIDICFKYGIDKEIDIFGLIGNWHGMDFKSPVYPEYKDPFRVSYYDEGNGKIKYISSKDELHLYIKLLLNHFINKGYIEKTRIFCDEPNNPELYEESKRFISSTVPGVTLKYKCAVHDPRFLLKPDSGITDSSIFLPMIGERFEKFEEVRESILGKEDSITWFVCCYPQRPNQFIASPPLESRLVGHITYMLKASGFLRWNYCLYTEDVYNNPSYKYPSWVAGDTFFVYPGSNMKPVSSIRWENMKMGIEEYTLMKMLEDKGYSYEVISGLGLYDITGSISSMKGDARSFKMGYSLSQNDYEVFRENLINLLLK
ncbi:DUF4091 domain-containing protein [Clostridium cylindrosporum]|uniref:Glycoside hydrolase 123 catalytic domain-containing protein n=1 Tax=Clostridium cylindrosporum DSM 605 TaxID=1121307 RepID=A0A0J8DCV9_CLOCY|nr:DUF4091 domain-containing protein [Clostridium cylindrosporum]KMT22094.1 hypothetical protein CLCY_4c00670 [Clostridium cylindrosporum DSM 605]